MTPELRAIIEQYNSLPEIIQQQIFYGETAEFARRVTEIFEINQENSVVLENEIVLILLGLLPREGLAGRLLDELETDIETSEIIVEMIDQEILDPILQQLEKNFVPLPEVKKSEIFKPEYFEIATTTPAPTQNYNEAQAAMIAETLAPEIRTMASDMAARSPERHSYEPAPAAEEPIYSSKQPEVRSTLSDLPSYTTLHNQTANSAKPTAPIEPPRWG